MTIEQTSSSREPETISLFRVVSWSFQGNFFCAQTPHFVLCRGAIILTVEAAKKPNAMIKMIMLTEPIRLKVLLES